VPVDVVLVKLLGQDFVAVRTLLFHVDAFFVADSALGSREYSGTQSTSVAQTLLMLLLDVNGQLMQDR